MNASCSHSGLLNHPRDLPASGVARRSDRQGYQLRLKNTVNYSWHTLIIQGYV